MSHPAVIYLKNMVHRYYDSPEYDEGVMVIDEETRVELRANILNALVYTPKAIRSQLELVFASVVKMDYPEGMPTLEDDIQTLLAADEAEVVYGAVRALAVLAETFEYRRGERREPFNALVERFFPLLATLFGSIVDVDTLESAAMQKVILHTYWCSFQIRQPPCLRTEESITTWMGLFAQVLGKIIPPGVAAEHHSDINQFPWYENQKQTMAIINRLLHRYGQPEMVPEEEGLPFAEYFRNQIAPSVVELILQVFSSWIDGERDIAPLVLREYYTFLEAAVRHSVTFGALKENLQIVYTECVFPTLCISDEDLEEWEDDPRFYVKRSHNVFEDFISPVTAAAGFLVELAKVRPQWGIPLVTQYASHVFDEFDADPSDMERARAKTGALLSLAAVAPKIITLNEYKADLEALMLNTILNDLSSPYNFLRLRAAYTAGKYWDMEFSSPEVHQNILTRVFSATEDEDLAVRITAGLALQKLIQRSDCDEYVVPLLDEILRTMLSLMGEIDSDQLVSALETIILRFGAAVVPLAVPIAESLAVLLERSLAEEKAAQDEEDLEAIFGGDAPGLASLNCMRALASLITTLRYYDELYPQLEEVLRDTLVRLTSPEGIDLLEEVMDLVSIFVTYSERPSVFAFEMLGRFIQAHFQWAFDYTRELLPPLCNIAMKAPEALVGIEDGIYISRLMEMYEKLLLADVAEYDSQYGCRIAWVLLLTCEGLIDDCVPEFIRIALTKLSIATTNALRVQCIEVVLYCIYYNPLATISILAQTDTLGDFFATWDALMDKFSRFDDKKVIILALTKLLAVPLEEYPDEFQGMLPGVINTLFGTCASLIEQIDKFEKKREELGLGDEKEMEALLEDEAEGWGEDEGIDDDEDKIDVRQVKYMEMLNTEYYQYEKMLQEDEDAEFADDFGLELPIDAINEMDFVCNGVEAFFQAQPEAANQLFSTLDSDPTPLLNDLRSRADEEEEKEKEQGMRALEKQVKFMSPEARAQFEEAQAHNQSLEE